MHVHLPKPLHGWRAFIGEVGVIVLGVLIALSAESLVDDWRWHRQVRLAENGIKEELQTAAAMGYERLIVQPCLKARLTELTAKVLSTSGPWKASPAISNLYGKDFHAVGSAYDAPNRLLATDAWQNAISSGTLNHMPLDHALALAPIYSEVRLFTQLQTEEATASSRLIPLAYDGNFNSEQRANLLVALGDVDRRNSGLALVATQMTSNIRTLRLGFKKTDVEQWQHYLYSEDRKGWGNCVAKEHFHLID
jgi:hypothetical protein